jgi:LysM repeat protein
MHVFSGFGEDNYIVYTVKSGDTLDKIAKKYGTTYQAIAKTNMLDNPNAIEVGQQLMIYTGSASPKAVSQVSSFSFPKVSLPPMSNKMVNYALIGGIAALGIPIAIKLIGQARAK